jgi:3-hydroxyisobutyrate dehydrogenase-like beta-hydroxyacid dehydrogenase
VLFWVADMVKDLGLALDLYGGAGSDTPMALVADDLFSRAAHPHGVLDVPAVAENSLQT